MITFPQSKLITSPSPRVTRLADTAAGFMAERFDAVGEFLGGGEVHDRMAAAVRAKGAEWSQPLFFQYENIGWGGNRIGNGTDILRRCWSDARRNGSTLIQFVTWSDYTENTCLAPAYETRYTIMDLNRHFIDWWKEMGPEELKEHLRRLNPEDFGRFVEEPDRLEEFVVLAREVGRQRLVRQAVRQCRRRRRQPKSGRQPCPHHR